MTLKFLRSKAAVAALLAASVMFSSSAFAGTLNLNGSTTVLPIMQQVTEAFHKQHRDITVTISGTGSGNGIKALRDGTTDIAMSSRDMKEKEVADFGAHGIKPVKITIAHDAIIPVVNPKNKVAGLSKDQIREIFAGNVKNWKEVGGSDAPIVVVGRDSSSGTFECWQELVMGKTRVSQRALLQSSNGGVVQAVAGNPNAIGYIGVGYLGKQVKGLSVNGVKPSAEAARKKTWPIARDLFLFTAKAPAGDAKKLIDYTLSRSGQQYVAKAGYVPLGK
ncbi:MAG: PstS family phosphate ABC transporter substrate-binding protein [Mesosutterella sp.]|nr:PstS family phosphate ABC transporter substrate-binding protein [Mesosutterella sp.]